MKTTFFSIRLMAQLMEDNSAVDPTYVEDFLLTYRTFLESPTIMVRILCFRFFSQSSQIFSHERNIRKNYNNQKLSNLQNFNPWTNWQKHQFCQITKCQIFFRFFQSWEIAHFLLCQFLLWEKIWENWEKIRNTKTKPVLLFPSFCWPKNFVFCVDFFFLVKCWLWIQKRWDQTTKVAPWRIHTFSTAVYVILNCL